MVSDEERLGRVYGRHVDLGFRRYATRTGRPLGSEYIVRLLVFVNRSTSLLLCWLVVSKHRLSRLWIRHKSKIFENCDPRPYLRSVFLRSGESRQRRGRSDRTAVGLAPLESTSSDW